MIGFGLGDLLKVGEIFSWLFKRLFGNQPKFNFSKRFNIFTFTWTHSQGRFIQLKADIRYLAFNRSSVTNTLVEVVAENPILGKAEISKIDDRRFVPLTIEKDHPKEIEFFAIYNVSIEDKDIQKCYSLNISFSDQYQKKHTIHEQIPLKDLKSVV